MSTCADICWVCIVNMATRKISYYNKPKCAMLHSPHVIISWYKWILVKATFKYTTMFLKEVFHFITLHIHSHTKGKSPYRYLQQE